MSAAFHMLAFGGKSEPDLFRGVFMQSGAAFPIGPLQDGQVRVYSTRKKFIK